MTRDTSYTKNRIAKNTLMLYFRMFITTLIGLYTSRVVLNTLGITDYGIYNVVGGVITMMSFLNSAMVSSSQRFLSYELGRYDKVKLNRVFITSINIHAAICFVTFIIAESIGIWFINTKLVIPEDRMFAANFVFQSSILIFIINVMSIPYNSVIVAHERMSAFAYISILDATLKLVITYILLILSCDKLIAYSILMVVVVLIIRLCYTIYCKKHFKECCYRLIIDKSLFVEMFSFAGWTVLGSIGTSFKNQISNIILNIFFGPSVNAARGVAIHVSSHVKTFATSFTMALNPQITKQYAYGNIDASKKLVYAGSRLSFYLMTLIAIPVIINIDYILQMWLGLVPDYTAQFVIFTIITSLIYTMTECVTKAIQATGRIKWFQIGICIIMLSELPLAWFLVKYGFPPYAVMWPSILTHIIAIFFRFWLIHNYVEGYHFTDYFIHVLLRCFLVFAISFLFSYLFSFSISATFMNLIKSTVICLIVTATIVYFVGLEKSERNVINSKIKTVLNGCEFNI